jgi:predicted DNA-binding transcriptional regulator AlpA
MDELIGSVEAGRLLGVTRQRVGELVQTHKDFPRPKKIAGRLVFQRRSIEKWGASHPDRRPGPRGPRTKP